MTQPFAIIGDIHGEARRLSALIREIGDRRLVFVGDYVNRGADTRNTLEQLIGLKHEERDTVFLLGNHDVALLGFLDGTVPFHEFAGLGGIVTIKSYIAHAKGDVRSEFCQAFPEAHRQFVECCDDYFETPDLLVSHCGVNPANPSSREKVDLVTGRHEDLFSQTFNPAKLVVCGHYMQSSGQPYTRGNLVCLDTGCGTDDGPLTALLMPERTFVQR